MKQNHRDFHVRGAFLVRRRPPGSASARALDAEFQEEEEASGEVVARFPANGFSAVTEGDEIVVYRGTPPGKTDINDMPATSDGLAGPPRTLAELNRFHSAHYGRRRSAR